MHSDSTQLNECIQYKCNTMSFGATRVIRIPQEQTEWSSTKSAGTVKFCKGVEGGLLKISGGTVMKLT